MRDISRKAKKPVPPPKPKPKPRAPAPKAPPVQVPPPVEKKPTPVIGYVHKEDKKEWVGYIGDEDAAITLAEIGSSVLRMKDVVAWINEVCEEKGYKLKEIVKL